MCICNNSRTVIDARILHSSSYYFKSLRGLEAVKVEGWSPLRTGSPRTWAHISMEALSWIIRLYWKDLQLTPRDTVSMSEKCFGVCGIYLQQAAIIHRSILAFAVLGFAIATCSRSPDVAVCCTCIQYGSLYLDTQRSLQFHLQVHVGLT